MEYCSKCHAPIESGTSFCTNCGTPVAPPASAPGRSCPKCGQALNPAARFCPGCGNTVAAPRTPPMPVSPPKSPAPAPAPKKKFPTGIFISVIAVVLVLALAVSWSFGLFGNDPIFELASQDGDSDRLSDRDDDDNREDEKEKNENPTEPSESEKPTEPELPTETVQTQPLPTIPDEPEVEEVYLKTWAPANIQEPGNDWLGAMQEAFQQAHPEYQIHWTNEYVSESDAGYLVAADVSAAADVYMFPNDQLGTLVNSGALLQLGGSCLEQILADNGTMQIQTVTHTDGCVYGFPVTNNTWFMYYNKDVFSEEDVKSLNTMLEKGTVGFPWNVGWYNGAFFLGNGCTIFGEYGNDEAAGFQFGGEKGYAAARAMIELVENPNMVTADVYGLMDGTVDACFSGSWDASALQGALGDKLGVVQLPTFDVDGVPTQMRAFAGTKCVGVNPTSTHVQVAAQFAAFLASTEGQLLRYQMCGTIPVAQTLRTDPAISADPVALAEMNTMSDCAVIQSSLPSMGNYWTPMETFGEGIVNGDIDMDNYKNAVDQLMEAMNVSGL